MCERERERERERGDFLLRWNKKRESNNERARLIGTKNVIVKKC